MYIFVLIERWGLRSVGAIDRPRVAFGVKPKRGDFVSIEINLLRDVMNTSYLLLMPSKEMTAYFLSLSISLPIFHSCSEYLASM